MIVLIITFNIISCGQKKSQLPWDQEPTLYEIAQTVSIERQLHPADPQPAGLWGGISPNLCTPQMKMSLWGPPERITLSMGKTDVWDRRKGWEKPVTLSEIKRGVFSVANRNDEAVPGWVGKQIKIMRPEGGFWDPYASWTAYPFPCSKPVGQAIILSDDFKEMNQQVTGKTQCHNGLTTVTLDHGDTHANIEYLPLMNEATTAIRASFRGLTMPVSVRLYRHRDIIRDGIVNVKWGPSWRLDGYDYEKDSSWNGPLDPPKAGKDGNYFWIHQKLPAEKTFPDGFGYYLVGKVIGTDVEVETVEEEFNLGTPPIGVENSRIDYELIRKAPGAAATALLPEQKNLEFMVLITVVTTNDGSNSDLLNIAKKRLESAENLGMNSLIAKNSNWYKAHYNKREHGRIYTGSVEDTKKQIPGLYRNWSGKHTGNTNPDPTRYESDAWQYSIIQHDGSPWHGLSCYNELYFTPEAVINRCDRFEYYVKLVNFWLDAARKNAREVYDMPGMCLIHGYIPPIKPDEYPHTTAAFELAMCTPAMVMKLLWDTWDYGGDELFLKEKVYPALKDLAIFYAAYVEKGNDGYYHVQPTIAQERWGITYQFKYNTDATASLAMIKWTLIRAAEAARVLQVDSEMQSEWLTIARDIAPYPTISMPEDPILTAVPGDTILQNPRHNGKLAPANLADEINLDSNPEDIELALRTARRNPDDRDANMVFHLLGADCGIAYPWIGRNVRQLDTLDNHNSLVNAYWAEPERLLNSRSGRIHLFPCVPDTATVAFKDFQAREGFLVSAEYKKGKVTYFSIKSRRDVECRIANTWLEGQTGRVTVVRERDNAPIEVKTDTEYSDGIVFQAQKGESYLVTESG
jgi:hypothetical protein